MKRVLLTVTAIGSLALLLLAIEVSKIGDYDTDVRVTASGPLADVLPPDGVIVLDILSSRSARNAQVDFLTLVDDEGRSHRIDLATAFDEELNKYAKCGRGNCLWVYLQCDDDECKSRVFFPVPDSLDGTRVVDLQASLTVDAEIEVDLETQVRTRADLGLPPDWDPPGPDVVFGRDYYGLEGCASRPFVEASLFISSIDDLDLTQLVLFLEAEASGHLGEDLAVFDSDGNRIETSIRPYDTSTSGASINHLFEINSNGRLFASIYVRCPAAPADHEQLVVGLVAANRQGEALLRLHPTVNMHPVGAEGLPFTADS